MADRSDRAVMAKVRLWPDDLRVEFEERAAILEYDAGNSRPEAERLAFEEFKGKAGW